MADGAALTLHSVLMDAGSPLEGGREGGTHEGAEQAGLWFRSISKREVKFLDGAEGGEEGPLLALLEYLVELVSLQLALCERGAYIIKKLKPFDGEEVAVEVILRGEEQIVPCNIQTHLWVNSDDSISYNSRVHLIKSTLTLRKK